MRALGGLGVPRARIKRIPRIWQLQNLEQSLNSLVRGRLGKSGRGKKAGAAPKF